MSYTSRYAHLLLRARSLRSSSSTAGFLFLASCSAAGLAAASALEGAEGAAALALRAGSLCRASRFRSASCCPSLTGVCAGFSEGVAAFNSCRERRLFPPAAFAPLSLACPESLSLPGPGSLSFSRRSWTGLPSPSLRPLLGTDAAALLPLPWLERLAAPSTSGIPLRSGTLGGSDDLVCAGAAAFGAKRSSRRASSAEPSQLIMQIMAGLQSTALGTVMLEDMLSEQVCIPS